MVAQVTDSAHLATMPSVTVAAPSPVVTPTREGESKIKSGSTKTRRKRLSPEESNDSSATVSQELFGDFMSIEEIAAQTEKAYQSRKLHASRKINPKIPGSPSPSRLLMPGSPKRSKAKKSVSTNKLPSTKKTYILIVLAAVLPFLLCESFLLVLTLRYRDYAVSEINTSAVDSKSLRHLKLESMDRKVESVDLVDLSDIHGNFEDQNSDVVNNAGEVSTVNYENSNANDEYLTTNQSTSSDCRDMNCRSNEEYEHKANAADIVSKHVTLEEKNKKMNETHEYGIFEYGSMLDEAFRLIAASKSTPANQKETVKLLSAETLCKHVLSRVREVSPSETDHSMDVGIVNNTFGAGTSDSTYNAHSLKLLEFNAQLCIGGVKMSTTSDEVGSLLQEAKNTFEHLAHLDPYSLEAQAGLGTSVLAQGLLNANHTSDLDNYREAQVSLITLATFHLKLASSLCSGPHGGVGRVVDKLHKSSVVPAESVSIETQEIGPDEQLRHSTNAAILHNLALAYIALGDSSSSVPLLLRAAAIQRQVEPQRNAFYWNLPDKVLQLMEEKAWLLGAKSKRKNQKKKRRIPFVPETLTFDEMLDGL